MINLKDILQYTQNLSILFVDDDKDIREQTQEILNSIFGTVDISEDGEEGLDAYKKYLETHGSSYDIVLSDISMPKMNGTELTKEIYKINPEQIVMILSAHNESEYLIELINLGVEQFIQKPIKSDKLILNILEASKKVINNNKQNSTQPHNFIYDSESKTIIHAGNSINLTKFEIIFIELLTSTSGKVYSNDQIVSHYDNLNQPIDPANIRKLVSKLRKKLPEDSLESIYGVGYKISFFNPTV